MGIPERRSQPARRPALVALVALLVLAASACNDEPPDDATMTDGLLVLSGDVGSVTLTVREGGATRGRSIDLPDPATTWVSAGRTNVLVATIVGGATYVSDPLGEDDPEWRLVEPITMTDLPPEGPLHFGTWDPPGGAYAQLGADFASGGGMRGVVVDPALEQAVEVTVDERGPVAAPPAWIDDDRVVFITRVGDGTEATIVDSTSLDSESGPTGVRLVATSADAGTTAVWGGDGSAVAVLPTTAWLAGEPAAIRIEPPDGAAAPAVLALDGTGSRLATVWVDDEGVPVSITVHGADREWALAATLGLGEAEAATVAWLR